MSRRLKRLPGKVWLANLYLKPTDAVVALPVALEMYGSQQRLTTLVGRDFSHRSASVCPLPCQRSSGKASLTLPLGFRSKICLAESRNSLRIRRSLSSLFCPLSREQILRVKEPAKLVPSLLLVENKRLLHFRFVCIRSVQQMARATHLSSSIVIKTRSFNTEYY